MRELDQDEPQRSILRPSLLPRRSRLVMSAPLFAGLKSQAKNPAGGKVQNKEKAALSSAWPPLACQFYFSSIFQSLQNPNLTSLR